MAGFGATVKKSKEAIIEAKAVEEPVDLDNEDMFSAFAAEQERIRKERITAQFIGLVGYEGCGKSGSVMHAFVNDKHKTPGALLHCLDFDTGTGMLASAIHSESDDIVSWNPWSMSKKDRTAFDYPGTHDRVVNIMRYIIESVERGNPVWGVLVSDLGSWLEVCNNNMRISDYGLARDGIEAADTRGAGDAKKVERQSDYGIRNTRFHQLTHLSRSLVRLGVRVYWETHLKRKDFYNERSEMIPVWENKTNGYLPTIIWFDKNEEFDDEGEPTKTVYTARFRKARTAPQLQDQERTVFVTHAGKEPEWFGLDELFNGAL